MQDNIENRLEFNHKMSNFYNLHKVKIYIFIILLFLAVCSVVFLNYLDKKKNVQIAEKYVQATLLLASNENKKAKDMFEEIILSKNKFYSVLALNVIVEKNLILNEKKILEYFEILKNNSSNKDQKDLITLKQAIYLIKKSDEKAGNKLLEKITNKDSILNSISRELLKNK